MKKLSYVLVALVIGLAGCTKKKAAPPMIDAPPAGTPVVTASQNGDRLILEVELTVPPKYQAKVKRTDLMLWDVKDENGNVLVQQMTPVPKFPTKLSVTANFLRRPVPEKAALLFAARIVKMGEERQPPMKGQLSALAGVAPSSQPIVKPAVDEKKLIAWEKKNDLSEAQVLGIGAKAKVDFAPILW